MCFYLRNWQVTFLLYTLGVKITEYIAKAPIEPRDYRVVFFIQKSACDRNYRKRFLNSGNDLLSRAVAHQVSSALRSLTTVFGMGTGVTSSLLSPNRY